MRKIFILTLLLIVLCINVYPEEQNEVVDWDKIDHRLFKELKEQHNLSEAQTYELLGRVYLQKDKWEKAAIFFDKAVQLDPKLCLSWYNLGLINMDNPELYFKKAIEANSKFTPPYYWLASYYSKCGRISESIEYFGGYLEVVDKTDPQEKGRIRVAEEFIKEIKAENTGYNIAKGEVAAKSKNAFNISVEHLYNCGEVGYLHYDLSLDGEVADLRIGADKRNIAFSLDYKKEDDSIQTIFAVVNIDSKSSEDIDEEKFKAFTGSQSAGELTCRPKLEQFVENRFKAHPGILGGTVHYDIASWSYSPDNTKIAFIVEGDDGHKNFYPSLYIADEQGDRIARVDLSSDVMCADVIWISDAEIIYSKDNVLWKAILKE